MKVKFLTRLRYFFKVLQPKYKFEKCPNVNLYAKNIEIQNIPTDEILLPHEHIPNFLKYIKFDRLYFEPDYNYFDKFIIYDNEKTDNDIDLNLIAPRSVLYLYYQGVDNSGNLIVSVDAKNTTLNRDLFFTISTRLFIRLLSINVISNTSLESRLRDEEKYKSLSKIEDSNKVLLEKLKKSEYGRYIEDFKTSIIMIKNNEY